MRSVKSIDVDEDEDEGVDSGVEVNNGFLGVKKLDADFVKHIDFETDFSDFSLPRFTPSKQDFMCW